MRFLKPILIITFWVLVSFVWVGKGQSAEPQKAVECVPAATLEAWLAPHPVLAEWYRFYTDRQTCITNAGDFFKTLASSETLSIKMNQAKITFDQFYIPLYHLMAVNWDMVREGKGENIQSDLTLLDQSLLRVMAILPKDNHEYFQEMVLLDLPSEFV